MENTENQNETTENVDQYELRVLKNIRDDQLEIAEDNRRRIDLMRGIILGLLYGVIGNIFVQHWYGLFEGLSSWNLNLLFWQNLAVACFALVGILLVSYDFYKQIKKAEATEKSTKDHAERIRIAIQKREMRLEKKRNEDTP
jgi:hypothetical protein